MEISRTLLLLVVAAAAVYAAPAGPKPSVIGELPDKLPDNVQVLNRRCK